MTEFEEPSPVTKERVRRFLCELDKSEAGFEFHEHGEHEYMFPLQSAVIFVGFQNPSILQIRGQWRGTTNNDEDFGALAQQVHMCNVQRSGPKAYLLPLSDGRRFGLGAEANMVISQGATSDQLTHFYEVALTMIIGYFQDVAKALPQLVDWEEA
ncbi:MAG: YbjN domain-containing protein [Actinomycetaceae bacterium]|nr:YbjN domain-containing protein [Actinomycetaceae bacterium]